jgi:protein-disulfide isomerase
MQQYPKAVRIQFRNFPLSFHPLAPVVHEAAVMAALQGHFWDFADFILQRQDSLREQDLIVQAGKVGLNAAAFAENLRAHRYAARVEADLENGAARNVHGSPVVFVNGRRIDGVPSLQTLIEDVRAALGHWASSKGAL